MAAFCATVLSNSLSTRGISDHIVEFNSGHQQRYSDQNISRSLFFQLSLDTNFNH